MSAFSDMLEGLYDDYAVMEQYGDAGAYDLNIAQDEFDGGDDHAAIENILKALTDYNMLCNILTDRYSPYGWRYRLIRLLSWCDDRLVVVEEAGGAEVDMAAIINAMLTADNDQVEYFIGLVDAYRLGIWDKPFNQELFRALGQGFRTWP